MKPIWIVDDDRSIRWVLEKALSRQNIPCRAFGSAQEVLGELERDQPQVLVSDVRMSGLDGIELLRSVKRKHPALPVIIMTAYSDLDSAVSAFQGGAFEYLPKPFDVDRAVELIQRAVDESIRESGEEDAAAQAPEILGQAPAMQEVFRAIGRLSQSTVTVLITGESGSGKEVVARALHKHSARASKPFIALNMAAIPRDLLESELFGHERGAFTGAHRRRTGRFEQASGGTLLLDEVGELTAAVQGKVLRVLEERSFERVGGGDTLTTDARLVAATNRDLEAMVATGEFRSDLFYRLDVFPIELPPLRERSSDLPALARHLLERLAARHGAAPVQLDDAAGELLAQQSWPGNVRQLANLLERAVILSERSRLSAADLQALLTPTAADDELERLRQALRDADGDKRRAAELLGVSYRTVLRRVAEHDLGGYPRYRD